VRLAVILLWQMQNYSIPSLEGGSYSPGRCYQTNLRCHWSSMSSLDQPNPRRTHLSGCFLLNYHQYSMSSSVLSNPQRPHLAHCFLQFRHLNSMSSLVRPIQQKTHLSRCFLLQCRRC